MNLSPATQALLDQAIKDRDTARVKDVADDDAIAAREAAIAAELKAKSELADALQTAVDSAHAFVTAVIAELAVKATVATP